MSKETYILLTMLIDTIIRSQYEKINVPQVYVRSLYARFPLQGWFNPVKSWRNKKSKYWFWQLIKSTALVMFTDYKHLLSFLRLLNWYIAVMYLADGYVVWWALIMFFIFFGLLFEALYLNWLGK